MNGLLSVYNHYTTGSVARRSNRYDSHNDSELKNIYNHIVKMSKESPVYKFDSSDSICKYAITIKEEARSLKNSLTALTQEDESGFSSRQKAAVSSDSDKVSVNYIGNSKDADETDGFDIQIDKLATKQVNTGTFLPDKKLSLMPGEYSFDIHTNSLCYGFQFQVSHNDTNNSIQKRLATLINKSNIGLHSTVLSEAEQGRSALQLESVQTGKGTEEGERQFTVTSTSDSNMTDVVRYFGLAHVTQEPDNSLFSIDGEEHSTASNSLIVGNDFEIKMNQSTDDNQNVRIGFKTNYDSVCDTIRNVANSYNSILNSADTFSSKETRSSLLFKDISSIAKRYKNALDSVGLTVNQDNRIEIDESLLNQALTEDIEDTFHTINDFKTSLANKSDEINIDPMNYVTKKIVAYPNPGKTFTNPYITSIYSGMLFNGYC